MIPLVPTLVLAFLSFISSAFVILRTIVPILPPHPLSRRVPPSEFGLPNYKSLAPADKTHLWLASCDLLALIVFLWQAVSETLGGPQDLAIANDPLSAVRLWFSNTIRTTCFFIIIGITLLHVRLGRPIDFGVSHWIIWCPVLVLVVTSTAIAGVLASTQLSTLFNGIMAYSIALTIFSTIGFVCLVSTLIIIKRNLTAVADADDSWPPMKQVEDKPRPSFATEDVDALKDGSSWITSNASSRAESVSAFSFSTHTHHTHHCAKHSNGSSRGVNLVSGSIPPKSSYWFNPATPFSGRGPSVPPVPPLPSPFRPSSPTSASVCDDPDPFHRSVGNDPRIRMGSQASWLTEPSVAQTTLTAWSFPPSNPGTPGFQTVDLNAKLLPSTAVSRPVTPVIAGVQVLGGYGYSAESALVEKGFAGISAVPEGDLDVPVRRIIAWLIHLWVPLVLSLPYILDVALSGSSSTAASILLVLSITLSSPLLALNLIFNCPLPVPSGLFDSPAEQTSQPRVSRSSSPTLTRPSWSHEYKRSGSVTVVEGRRSGDVWLSNGDAVDGRKKIGRALEMLNAKPKLSVLPFEDNDGQLDGEITPPLPIQEEPATVPPTPQSENSAEVGRTRKESKASSYYSGADESVAYATRIMIAQRHYSALATTMVLPPSPDVRGFNDVPTGLATGVATSSDIEVVRASHTHLRSRSISSVSAPRSAISPPPSSPLPPTPPSVKASRAALRHRKSQSSGFSFGAVLNDDMNEIDALSARVLPLLVPGLKIGQDVKIRDDWRVSPPTSYSRGSKAGKNFRAFVNELPAELGGLSGEFSSPEVHSTPAAGRRPGPRTKKISGHKRHHFSLPSLSLGQDGVHSLTTWRHDPNRVLESKPLTDDPALLDSRRITAAREQPLETGLSAVLEDDELLRPVYTVGHQSNSAESRPPSSTDVAVTARSSLVTLINALDSEFQDPLVGTFDSTIFNLRDESGPQAQSTPHDPISHEPIPPIPKASRRSSIVYIKSDENSSPNREMTISSKHLAQWSSRAVKPLMTKPSKPKGKLSSTSNNGNVMASPGGGLRTLSLLQERDTNRSAAIAVVDADNSNIRPLALRKKQKVVTDENAEQPPKKPTKNLKSLKLARTDTTKMRAILRKEEVLPEVVVRPPSASEHTGFGYDFRQ